MTSYLPAPIVQAHLERKSWPWIISSVLVSFCPWGRLSNFCRVLTMRPQMPGKLLKKRPAAHSTVPRKPLRADVTPPRGCYQYGDAPYQLLHGHWPKLPERPSATPDTPAPGSPACRTMKMSFFSPFMFRRPPQGGSRDPKLVTCS